MLGRDRIWGDVAHFAGGPEAMHERLEQARAAEAERLTRTLERLKRKLRDLPADAPEDAARVLEAQIEGVSITLHERSTPIPKPRLIPDND